MLSEGAPSVAIAEETRRAKESMLGEVGTVRRPASDVVSDVHEHHPELGLERIRTAMWELVGSQDLRLGWDGSLEREG